MGFKPMDFGHAYRTISEANSGNTLQLSPPTSAITLPKQRPDANAGANCDCFDVGNVADNLKMHEDGFLSDNFKGASIGSKTLP